MFIFFSREVVDVFVNVGKLLVFLEMCWELMLILKVIGNIPASSLLFLFGERRKELLSCAQSCLYLLDPHTLPHAFL